MSNRSFAIIAAVVAVVGGLSVARAQQKPVSSRTSVVVYKSPT